MRTNSKYPSYISGDGFPAFTSSPAIMTEKDSFQPVLEKRHSIISWKILLRKHNKLRNDKQKATLISLMTNLPGWLDILVSMPSLGEFEANAICTPWPLRCLISRLAPGRALMLHHLQHIIANSERWEESSEFQHKKWEPGRILKEVIYFLDKV